MNRKSEGQIPSGFFSDCVWDWNGKGTNLKKCLDRGKSRR
jgi:hypothetical protein